MNLDYILNGGPTNKQATAQRPSLNETRCCQCNARQQIVEGKATTDRAGVTTPTGLWYCAPCDRARLRRSTVKELRRIAKARGVSLPSRARKAGILASLLPTGAGIIEASVLEPPAPEQRLGVRV
jgi:hypothetical protein